MTGEANLFNSEYLSMIVFKQREEEIKKLAEQHRINTEKPEDNRRRRIVRVNND